MWCGQVGQGWPNDFGLETKNINEVNFFTIKNNNKKTF
jgi:hypothetical protein